MAFRFPTPSTPPVGFAAAAAAAATSGAVQLSAPGSHSFVAKGQRDGRRTVASAVKRLRQCCPQ